MGGNTEKAIAFLEHYRPGGPWALTAIVPDGSITTRTFHDNEAMSEWIKQRQGKQNLYFHVNPTFKDVEKKAIKAEIKEVQALHVDVDPRIGKDLGRERKRILELIRNYKIPPTIIVDSGGGFQAFWLLDKPFELDGTSKKWAEIEAFNRQIEIDLGGDSCWNVDRVMRLPFTVNIPNKRKLEKGRTEALSAVVEFHQDRLYSLDQFDAAPLLKNASSSPDIAEASYEVRDFDLEKLPIDRWLRTVIIEGLDPDDPEQKPSRSEWEWLAINQMIAAEISEDVIYSVLLDDTLNIGVHCRDQQDPPAYAAKEIAKAKYEHNHDEILRVNQSYFAALEGGKLRFYREDPDSTLASMNHQAFLFELGDRWMEIEKANRDTVKVPVAKVWLSDRRRRYYRRGFVLDPKYQHDPHHYNLWKGFGVEPKKGVWSLMRDHILNILAKGDEEYAEYILNWTAWSFQNPATPPRVALVFRGKEGVGKGVFATNIRRAFGVHGMRIQSMAHLTGRFNAHLRHLCLLFADEAVAPRDRAGEGTLKGLITETTIPIEKKGIDLVTGENHLHVIMASNADWVAPVGIEARRFAMFDVSEGRRGDRTYFDALWGQMESGGVSAILHDLLERDVSGFSPEADRPETEALQEQKAKSLHGFELVWLDILRAGEIPLHKLNEDYSARISTQEISDYATKRLRRGTVSFNSVGSLFGEMDFEKIINKRPRGYIIPLLPEARQIWDRVRFPVAWDNADKWLKTDEGR